MPEPINLERTLALIKPDSIDSLDEIIRLIRTSGFSVLSQRRVALSPEQGILTIFDFEECC